MWRIKRNHHEGEPTLHNNGLGAVWAVGGASRPSKYESVSWDAISDQLFDYLEPETLEEFLATDAQTTY